MITCYNRNDLFASREMLSERQLSRACYADVDVSHRNLMPHANPYVLGRLIESRFLNSRSYFRIYDAVAASGYNFNKLF